MRILQVFNQYLEPGGEEVWVNQVKEMGSEAMEIEDLRFQSGAWVGRAAPHRFRQAALLWNNPESRRVLREHAEAYKPDVLLFHNLIPVASLGLYDEARHLGLPVVQYIHNFRPFSPSGTLWVRDRVIDAALRGNPWPEVWSRGWERSFFKTALLAVQQQRLVHSGKLDVIRKWIAISDFMRESFIEAGIPEERIVTLHHCWQTGGETRETQEGRHYLFLGRLVPEKGIQTMLDAWAILEKTLGDRCPRLVIAGIGNEEAKTHLRANHLRSVTCVGFVSGSIKQDLINRCRAVVAPSIWWEPLGLIVHEAYDAARPVLAARSGGLTETVQDAVTGLLHQPGSAEDLAEDVRKLEALGESGRRRMGQAGRAWLQSKASPGLWKERFNGIMQSVASQR